MQTFMPGGDAGLKRFSSGGAEERQLPSFDFHDSIFFSAAGGHRGGLKRMPLAGAEDRPLPGFYADSKSEIASPG
jgi:hypothetical protein